MQVDRARVHSQAGRAGVPARLALMRMKQTAYMVVRYVITTYPYSLCQMLISSDKKFIKLHLEQHDPVAAKPQL